MALREQGRLPDYFIKHNLFSVLSIQWCDSFKTTPGSLKSSLCSQIPSCLTGRVGTREDICRETPAFDRICLPSRLTGRVSWAGFLSVPNACGVYISQGNTLKHCVNLDGKGASETPAIVQTVGWIFCVHFKLFKLIKH